MRFVIISGGHIDDAFALNYLEENEYDCMIAADSGMNFLHRNGLVPDIIAGDFESVQSSSLQYFQGLNNVQVIKLNPMKDDTDTEFVIREAIRRGATEIIVLGATGTRLDHVLANVNLLGIGLEENVSIELVDAHNRIRMISGDVELKCTEQFGDFVSLLPINGNVTGVTLEGFKYLLKNAVIPSFSSLGISNEIVEKSARIKIDKGVLLMIEARDSLE